jgi:predicted MFS family arabinose efflux permease
MGFDAISSEGVLVLPDEAEPTGTSDRTLWIMAIACGTFTANIYCNQPLLGDLAKYFHASDTAAGMVATAAQLGYAAGIFFFVPLGDLIERRRLVLSLSIACFVSLLCAAAAPVLWMLVVCQLIVGITTVSAQVLIPLAIDLAPTNRRGHTVGVLMTGILAGILLARTVAGFVSDALGWRSTYLIAAVVVVVMISVLAAALPHRPPTLRTSYPRLMHSMIELLRHQPQLWISAAMSGLTFATFIGFWATLSFLMADQFHRGASAAGMFGIIGIAGALAAPVAGKLADKRGPAFTVTVSVIIAILAFIIMGVWVTIPGLIIGVLLMDLGVQATAVSEQSTVMALVPEARSRLNTLYMVCRFVSGAIGSALCVAAWARYRWTGVCTVNLILLLLAMTVHLLGCRWRRAALIEE